MRLVLCLAVLIAAAPFSGRPAADTLLAAPALDAITGAVRARMGSSAEVTVAAVKETAAIPAFDEAVLAPGGRLELPVRVWFRGRKDGATRGLATVAAVTVRLEVSVEHAHAAHAVTHGRTLGAADVIAVRHAIARGPLRRLPTAAEVEGATALRDLPEGACLTAAMVSSPPAIVAGAEVVAVVRSGEVEVRATLEALDSGPVGARIRVMNPETRRTVRARVVSKGLVEIGHD